MGNILTQYDLSFRKRSPRLDTLGDRLRELVDCSATYGSSDGLVRVKDGDYRNP